MHPPQEELKSAASVIERGGLVVFPTETVYGLGANSLVDEAVKRIFEVKGRPSNMPLTYHLHSSSAAAPFINNVSEAGKKLMQSFLPGPLTLVFEKSSRVPDIIAGGGRKVGIRVPSHPLALEFLKALKVPLVATSANISGKPSSTSIEHIMKDLGEKVDLIIDAGDSPLGIESTVLDVTTDPPRLIRPGYITQEEIARVIGVNPLLSDDQMGMPRLPRYAPKARIIIVEGDSVSLVSQLQRLAGEYVKSGRVVMVISEESLGFLEDSYPDENISLRVMGSRRNYHGIALHLFRMLRDLEDEDIATILVEGIPREGLGVSIMERLARLAGEARTGEGRGGNSGEARGGLKQ
jgi:L-threonylcarbamoyladenylate synthase